MKITSDINLLCEKIYVFNGNDLLLEENRLPSVKTACDLIKNEYVSDFYSEPDMGYSAIMLKENAAVPENCSFIPLRQYFFEYDNDSFSSARSHGFLKLRELYKFCPTCGGKLKDDDNFTAKVCCDCNRQLFPRIEPAVIVLVNRGDEVLLVQNKGRSTDWWACIAGFVELGESVENAVHREVMEETGIKIKNLVYKGSQSWPFPDQLMFAFTAEYESGEIRIQEEELEAARWFKRSELPSIPKPGSVAWNLINDNF